MSEASEPDPVPSRLALGITLHLLRFEEGRRSRPLGVLGNSYGRNEYRPNWKLPGMEEIGQLGAPVLCIGKYPLPLGDSTRAVIVPISVLELWWHVRVGDKLNMFEGPRICAHAVVEWASTVYLPTPANDEERFNAWVHEGENVPKSN